MIVHDLHDADMMYLVTILFKWSLLLICAILVRFMKSSDIQDI